MSFDPPPDLSEQEIAALVARCPAEVRALFEGWLRGTHHLDGERTDDGESAMSQTVQEQTKQTSERRHVKLWFGKHVIGEYIGEPDQAERYAAAMDRRFAGLHITTDIVPPGVTPERALPLPSKRLWGNTPH